MFLIRFIWAKLKGGRLYLIIGLLLSMVVSTMIIINPYLTRSIVDTVTSESHNLEENGRKILTLLGIMCLVVLLRTCLIFLRVVCLEKSSQTMLMNIRTSLFTRIQTQEMAYFDRMRSGDLITRTTGDLEYMRHFVAWVTYQTVDTVVMFTAAIIMLTQVSWQLTLAMISVLPFILITSILYARHVRPLYRDIRQNLADLNIVAQENIDGNRVVKAFAREDYEIARFDKTSRRFHDINLRATYASCRVVPVLEFFAQSLSFITLLVGGFLCIRGDISLGDLTLFTSLTWALANPMRNISGLLSDWQRFGTSAQKVIELSEDFPLITDRPDAVATEGRLQGKVEFRNVTFAYGKHIVLDNVSFVINPGETVAVMGPTGGGKTTLINLIARFREPTKGMVLLDDVDVHMRRLSDIHRSVGIAAQGVFLFSDTIDGNIAFSNPEMSEEAVHEYASYAAADGFISETADGYETIVGERGMGLSGGQKQRVALARALASEPAVLILDDTTSAVDMETEAYIQEKLRHLPFPCTKIIIAQRISSVRHADRIMILEDGHLDIGTHESLARENAYYRHVCELQDALPASAKGGEN